MDIVVLLSAGRHPASGRAMPVTDELRAIRLAGEIGQPSGLHAGPSNEAVAPALGHGIDTLRRLNLAADADPVDALADALQKSPPELVLAGRRAMGSDDTGMLPYLLAARLGWPIVTDATALNLTARGLAISQALPGGGRRAVEMKLPGVVTVGPAAPPPRSFAFAAQRRGRIIEERVVAATAPGFSCQERPYRQRPRMLRDAPSAGTAADRLRRSTEITGTGQLMVDPEPEAAAAAILDFLDRLRLLPETAE